METEVVSVRIQKRTRRDAKRLGINLKELIERTLTEEITKANSKRLARVMKKATSYMDVDSGEWAKEIRASRDQR